MGIAAGDDNETMPTKRNRPTLAHAATVALRALPQNQVVAIACVDLDGLCASCFPLSDDAVAWPFTSSFRLLSVRVFAPRVIVQRSGRHFAANKLRGLWKRSSSGWVIWASRNSAIGRLHEFACIALM
jgi:hypothetical protein